jgi:site-specific DNA recombinase
LVNDPRQTVAALALREGKTELLITLSLALLAPNLVTAAVEGRLPRGIGLKRLVDPPIASEQWRSFGLRAPTCLAQELLD